MGTILTMFGKFIFTFNPISSVRNNHRTNKYFLRLLRIDFLDRKMDEKRQSYWINVNKRKTNFNNQY